jgi:hypothetical protein
MLEKKATFERTLALYQSQLRLVQLLQQNKGRVSDTMVRLAQLRVARKIARLEKKLKRDSEGGKQLLP